MYFNFSKKLLPETVLVLKKQNEMLSKYSCLILMKLEFSRQIFKKYRNTKFHEIPSSGSRVVPCRRTNGRTDRQIDIMKLTVAFRTSATEPKKFSFKVTKVKCNA
jgi:hypothetical protein